MRYSGCGGVGRSARRIGDGVVRLMDFGIVAGNAFAHGPGCKSHPSFAIETEAGIESGTQAFGIGERQCHQGGGHVARDVFEDDADLLRAVGRGVFGAERKHGIIGERAGGAT